MAVYATNATVGPEGLCPMPLVFAGVPRRARAVPSITQLKRVKAIGMAILEVENEKAHHRIAFGLRHSGDPKRREHSLILRSRPTGAPVLVSRTTTKRWEGLYRFVNISGETAVIQTNRGRSIFRSTCVKPQLYSIFSPRRPEPEHNENAYNVTTKAITAREFR